MVAERLAVIGRHDDQRAAQISLSREADERRAELCVREGDLT